jgi:hypothetical protein
MDSSDEEDNNFNNDFFDELQMQITETNNHFLLKEA